MMCMFYLQKFTQNIYYNMYSGYDERFPLNKTYNAKELINIKKNIEKKELLDTLQNNNLSNIMKLMLINDHRSQINIQFSDPEW